MTRKRSPGKTYTKEFKAEAVRLMQASDRPASEIATQLNIRRNQLNSSAALSPDAMGMMPGQGMG